MLSNLLSGLHLSLASPIILHVVSLATPELLHSTPLPPLSRYTFPRSLSYLYVMSITNIIQIVYFPIMNCSFSHSWFEFWRLNIDWVDSSDTFSASSALLTLLVPKEFVSIGLHGTVEILTLHNMTAFFPPPPPSLRKYCQFPSDSQTRSFCHY